ncbi:hypothetical protein T492DRAFT_848456 [Pavlovales sp. CCMP2436]|nr:hypothetical protein T492DRAFT_848456 [Pavlovales sp. CCMP2436]
MSREALFLPPSMLALPELPPLRSEGARGSGSEGTHGAGSDGTQGGFGGDAARRGSGGLEALLATEFGDPSNIAQSQPAAQLPIEQFYGNYFTISDFQPECYFC